MLLALTAGCGPAPRPEDPAPDVVPLSVALEPIALLRRLSLDIRGELPSEAELASTEEDPATLELLTEEMLASDAFERRFADLIAEQWLTRVDVYNVATADYDLDPALEPTFESDIGNEVPVLLAAIAAEDLPWTDAVLADWTFTTDLLSSIWPVETIEGRASAVDGWTRARYTDGRPAGGVVMTNGLWWRYWSAPNNYNRSRAAAIGRLLLCDDWLTRPVAVDAGVALETSSLETAARTEPTCVACHDTLDPLASALFGFWWFDLYDPREMRSYHTEREMLGERYLGVTPAWFGHRIDAPVDLGPRIAEDPRFARCAVERVLQAYTRRPVGDDDFTAVTEFEAAFEAEGLTIRGLVRAILQSDEYRAGGLTDAAPDDSLYATRRIVQPSQLETMIEQATGYTWSLEGYAMLGTDDLGYRVLAGGVDGTSVTGTNEEPSVTRAAVFHRLAEAAASHVVTHDFDAESADRVLLRIVTRDDAPGSEPFSAQLTALSRQLHGRDPTEEELAAETALAEAVMDAGGAEADAWAAIIELLLRDPAFWTY